MDQPEHIEWEMNKIEKGISPVTKEERWLLPFAFSEGSGKSVGLSVLCLLFHPVYCHETDDRGKFLSPIY